MPQKITDDELIARVDQEMRMAQDYMGGKLSQQRRKALQYYMGKAEGDLSPPEVEGRSSFVSTDVADTVEWILPSLLRIFTSSDRVVQLSPRKKGMEQTAEDATDFLNWIFTTQNNGFHSLYTMFKDALISKTGILKVWWDDHKEQAREEYKGLSDGELAQLLDDKEVEPIEHSSRPDEEDVEHREKAIEQLSHQLAQAQQAAQQGNAQALQASIQLQAQIDNIQQTKPVMVHDVTVKRTKAEGQVRIEPVPPEEFFISRNGKQISTSPFVAHVVERTVSYLRAQGFNVSDDELSSDEAGMVSRSGERMQRWSFDDSSAPYPQMMEPSSDPSMRTVWVVEAYLQADVDGDGIAEWRKILKVGHRILDNCECDGPPFVSVTPIPMPHRFMGLSIADLTIETQKQKTAMVRAMQDNLYLQVNGRYYAVDGQVNLDDLLTSRPGGVVRVKSQGAVGPLNQGMADMRDSYQLLEYMETQKENRTGFSRNSQGLNPEALDRTATETRIVTNRADIRTELIARVFAETGVKDLFSMILKLVCQYQDQPAEFNLNGRWLEVNPREWRHQFDVCVNVGLGTNDPGQKMSQIGHLMAVQEKLGPFGIVSPKEAYNAASELIKAMGYKDSTLFIQDPQNAPPKPPPPPDPRVQIEQMRIQDGHQRFQAEQQHAQEDAQRAAALEQHKQEMQAQQNQHQQALEAQRKLQEFQMKAEMDERERQVKAYQEEQRLAFDKWKAELDAAVKISVAEIAAKTTMDSALLSAQNAANSEVTEELGGEAEPEQKNVLAAALSGFSEALMQLKAPRQIVRGPDGKAQGIV